jgi:dihydroxyacetone kinase-like predicted kinase
MPSNIYYQSDVNKSLKMIINADVYKEIESMNKIILHTGSEKKEIKFDKRNTLKNIMKKVRKLKENESMHFIFENREFILYRSYKEFDWQQYSIKMFEKFLRYILNTKNTKLIGKYIHLIDSKVLKKLSDEEKIKINKFIQISNKNNEILLKHKMCNDIIKHTINKMINPEEIEKVCVYEGEKRSNIVNEKVESFLDKCNEKTEKELIKLIDEILKDVESIDDLIKEKKYKNIKKTIKTNIIKNLYRLNFTDLANTLFKKRPNFLQINKNRAIDLKTQTDDVEFHRILDCFLEKY